MPDISFPPGPHDKAMVNHANASLWLVLLSLVLFLPGFFTLPPMDRDEPRFAQATRQMLETGDYVAIRFQDEARNKKPVGIYWLQAGVVRAGEILGVPDARRTIWLYRLPSLFGAIGAVLLTYWAALPFVTRRNAFIAAMLLASTILLGVEARLAKTDAVVTLTVVAAMGALARLRLREDRSFANAAIFWTAIGAGILVKGPITPMIPAFAAVVLSVQDRSARWLLPLRPVLGLLWCAAIAAPWLVLIYIKTSGAFFSDAIGGDMLDKLAGAKEAHGAPPLTYLTVFWLTAWPMAPFAALAAPFVWNNGRLPKVAFLLAWLVPAWALFELVPTKLPHYVLPLYPAITVLVAMAVEAGAMNLESRWRKAVAMLLPLVGLALPALAIAAMLWFKTGVQFLFIVLALGLVLLSMVGGRNAIAGRLANLAGQTFVFSFVMALLAYSSVLATDIFMPFNLSTRMALAGGRAAAIATNCPALLPATTGYREPSLVFLTRTDLFMTSGAGAAEFLDAAPCRIASVDAAQEPAFTAALRDHKRARLSERITGINLNGGKALDIGVYVRQDDAP